MEEGRGGEGRWLVGGEGGGGGCREMSNESTVLPVLSTVVVRTNPLLFSNQAGCVIAFLLIRDIK